MAKTKPRLKTPALLAMQTRPEVQSAIYAIGAWQREHARVSSELNDKIACLTNAEAPRLKELQGLIAEMQKAVQVWCEAHRDELCSTGKSANLVTGVVQWRQRPPRVVVSNSEGVIAWLKQAGMTAFLRTKEEVNKDAMLADQAKASRVPGVRLVTGEEDFVITPFEVDTEAA